MELVVARAYLDPFPLVFWVCVCVCVCVCVYTYICGVGDRIAYVV